MYTLSGLWACGSESRAQSVRVAHSGEALRFCPLTPLNERKLSEVPFEACQSKARPFSVELRVFREALGNP